MYGKQQLAPDKDSYSDAEIASMSKYWSVWYRSLILGMLMRIFGDPKKPSMLYFKAEVELLRDRSSQAVANLCEFFEAALNAFLYLLVCAYLLVGIVTWPVWVMLRIPYMWIFGSTDAAVRADLKTMEDLKYDEPTNTWLRKQKGGVW